MSFILVEWVNETPRQFSTCKKSDISDGELREAGSGVVGATTLIKWKRKEYPGKILRIGILNKARLE